MPIYPNEGKFATITVQVRDSKTKVQAKRGYWSVIQ